MKAMAVVLVALLAVGAYMRLRRSSDVDSQPAQTGATSTSTSTSASAAPAPLAEPSSIERDLQELERQMPAASEDAPPSEPSDTPPSERSNTPSERSSGVERARNETVTGTWNLTTQVTSASNQQFEGLRLGFRLRLTQDGNRVTGHGEKWSENGRALDVAARTPIDLEGTIDADRIDLAFTEYGARRDSGGRLVMERTTGSEFRGTFTSDAARSRGSALARRAK